MSGCGGGSVAVGSGEKAGPSQPRAAGASGASGASIVAAGQVSPSTGWALTATGLYATSDGGSSWTTITPPGIEPAAVHGVHFEDSTHGFAVVVSGSSLSVERTTDGGQSWAATSLPAVDPRAGFGQASFDFPDPAHGWLSIDTGSNANFSYGAVFATSDGGATWQKLPAPIYAPVQFVDDRDGWLAGGAGMGSLYVTHDGGQTWLKMQVTAPSAYSSDRTLYDVTPGDVGTAATLPVVLQDPSSGRPDAVALYAVGGGARTWTLSSVVAYPSPDAGVSIPVDLVGPGGAVVALPEPGGGTALRSSSPDSAATTTTARGLPGRPSALSFSGPSSGWALVGGSSCSGYKSGCSSEQHLWSTSDGGASWAPLAVP